MNPGILVLLSGGMDSATVLASAVKTLPKPVHALAIDYGQAHRKEIRAAQALARYFEIDITIAKLDLQPFAGESQILNPTQAFSSTHSSVPADQPGIAPSWVPGRNVMLLGAAAAFGYLRGLHTVGCGVNYTDYSGYPDCRPPFIASMEESLQLALADPEFELFTPVLNLSKKQIVELGDTLGVPWELTWSCYRGEEVPCGKCGACEVRAKGFADAGRDDPAPKIAGAA